MPVEYQRVAMVGAGISGLVCAQRLESVGISVSVFEKARGPGGRISTRRREGGRFDHGAQYVTVHSEAFGRQVEAWADRGVVAPWTGRFATWRAGRFEARRPLRTRWVGTPRMSVLGRHLATGLSLQLRTRIVAMTPTPRGWQLDSEDGRTFADFDAVLMCCPGPQARDLLPADSGLSAVASGLEYAACWSLMLDYDEALALPFDGITFAHPVLRWAARESSKPGRAPGERWVLHTTPAWSDAHVTWSAADVVEVVVKAWGALVAGTPRDVAVHRWRYALAEGTDGPRARFDAQRRVGLCGDGLVAPRVEDAWHSGRALADAVLAARA